MGDRDRESNRDDWSLGTILLGLAILAILAGGVFVYRQRMVRQQLMVVQERMAAEQARLAAMEAQAAATTAQAAGEQTAEDLKQQNAALQAENERLIRELEQSKKATATTPEPSVAPPG